MKKIAKLHRRKVLFLLLEMKHTMNFINDLLPDRMIGIASRDNLDDVLPAEVKEELLRVLEPYTIRTDPVNLFRFVVGRVVDLTQVELSLVMAVAGVKINSEEKNGRNKKCVDDTGPRSVAVAKSARKGVSNSGRKMPISKEELTLQSFFVQKD